MKFSLFQKTNKRFWKHVALTTAILFLCLLVIASLVTTWRSEPMETTRYGITYSTIYAKQLKLDPEVAYKELVEDLDVKLVRLPIYWSDIEATQGVFDFALYDRLIKESERQKVKLTLAIGSKVPRWPECFLPSWAKTMSIPDQQTHILLMLRTVVDRYKSSPAIERWQVQNEPFLPFGECTQISEKDFDEQIQLVRLLDTRPIQLTVSGELQPWSADARRADVLGFSLYRKTWSEVIGYSTYPFPPEFYRLRTLMIKKDVEQVIVSELQAEPWFSEPMENKSLDHWYKTFSAEDFNDNIQFVKDTHAQEVYLWGAEWWVYLKKNGDDRLMKVAETVFKKTAL